MGDPDWVIDLNAARTFVHGHARLLDRRRFQHGFDGDPPDLVLTALTAYRNPDGGFGALEPDLRTPASQPIPTRYAFDVLAEVPRSPTVDDLARGALDWLASATNDDGGVPFVLPSGADQPAAPWLSPSPESALLSTAQLVAAAQRLQPDHPWVARAGDYCWRHLNEQPELSAHELLFVIDFLDAFAPDDRAAAQLAAVADRIPANGRLPVQGGADGESLDPLNIAPHPQHAGAGLIDRSVLEGALDELETSQLEDGGWDFSWAKWNPAAAWEWRGAVTIDALRTLRAYGRL